MTIRFLKFKVVNSETGASCKVWYSANLDETGSVKSIDVTEKNYGHDLEKVGFENVRNETDIMSDYFAKSSVRIPAGSRYFDAAFAAANSTKYYNGKLVKQKAEETEETEVFSGFAIFHYNSLLYRMGCFN